MSATGKGCLRPCKLLNSRSGHRVLDSLHRRPDGGDGRGTDHAAGSGNGVSEPPPARTGCRGSRGSGCSWGAGGYRGRWRQHQDCPASASSGLASRGPDRAVLPRGVSRRAPRVRLRRRAEHRRRVALHRRPDEWAPTRLAAKLVRLTVRSDRRRPGDSWPPRRSKRRVRSPLCSSPWRIRWLSGLVDSLARPGERHRNVEPSRPAGAEAAGAAHPGRSARRRVACLWDHPSEPGGQATMNFSSWRPPGRWP